MKTSTSHTHGLCVFTFLLFICSAHCQSNCGRNCPNDKCLDHGEGISPRYQCRDDLLNDALNEELTAQEEKEFEDCQIKCTNGQCIDHKKGIHPRFQCSFNENSGVSNEDEPKSTSESWQTENTFTDAIESYPTDQNTVLIFVSLFAGIISLFLLLGSTFLIYRFINKKARRRDNDFMYLQSAKMSKNGKRVKCHGHPSDAGTQV